MRSRAARRGAGNGGGRRGLHRSGRRSGWSSSTSRRCARGPCRWVMAARWPSFGGSGDRGWTRASSSSPASATPSRPSRRCRTARWATCSRRNRPRTCLSPFARWRAVGPYVAPELLKSCRPHRPGSRSIRVTGSQGLEALSRREREIFRHAARRIRHHRGIARRLSVRPEDGRIPPNEHQPQARPVRTTADLVRFAVAHGILHAPRALDAPEARADVTAS